MVWTLHHRPYTLTNQLPVPHVCLHIFSKQINAIESVRGHQFHLYIAQTTVTAIPTSGPRTHIEPSPCGLFHCRCSVYFRMRPVVYGTPPVRSLKSSKVIRYDFNRCYINYYMFREIDCRLAPLKFTCDNSRGTDSIWWWILDFSNLIVILLFVVFCTSNTVLILFDLVKVNSWINDW